MRVNQLVLAGSMMIALGSAEVFAQSQARKCPRPTPYESQLTEAEFSAKMGKEIEIRTRGMNRHFVEQFLFEYEKFPSSLRSEMVQEGGKIHLIQGEGVTADSTWGSSMFTKDGRDWSLVPGSGGSIFSYPKNPTRLVVNHLYDRHGSVNLVLHEHAHTLDHLYSEKDLSKSKAWTELIQDENNQNIMRGICGYYCLTDVRESFAELFAYYHACEETRQHLEQVLPTIADFMRNLTSVKEFKQRENPRNSNRRNNRRDDNRNDVREDRNGDNSGNSTQTPRRRRTVGDFFRNLFDDIEDIVN